MLDVNIGCGNIIALKGIVIAIIKILSLIWRLNKPKRFIFMSQKYQITEKHNDGDIKIGLLTLLRLQILRNRHNL